MMKHCISGVERHTVCNLEDIEEDMKLQNALLQQKLEETILQNIKI